MHTAFDVSKYFIDRANEDDDGSITNLKLQKLLYYAQGFSLAIFDRPMFQEPIEAWMHGPVCPPVYHEYKSQGKNNIAEAVSGDCSNFSTEEIDLLEEVFSVFGQFSAWKLRDMTHSEAPWIAHEERASEIPHEELQAYFKTRVV